MGLNLFPFRSAEPEYVVVPIRFEGAGAASPAAPTDANGHLAAGATLSWVSTGIYRITFRDYQGSYAGICGAPAIGDTVPAGVAGFTAHPDEDSYDATNKRVDIHIYNAAQALADLPATSYLTCLVAFKRSKIRGN